MAAPIFFLLGVYRGELAGGVCELRPKSPAPALYPVTAELCSPQPQWWDFKGPSKCGTAPKYSTCLLLESKFHHREGFFCIGGTL